MAAPSLNYILVEDKPLDVAMKAWRRDICKKANADVGEYWLKKYLLGHFRPGAAEKYKYRPRSESYLKNKKRLSGKWFVAKVSGQIVDNVFTGKMRAAVRKNRLTRGFPTRVTVTMFGPKYLTTRFRNVDQPNKPAEITAVTPDEENDLAEYASKRMAHYLRTYRASKRRTKG